MPGRKCVLVKIAENLRCTDGKGFQIACIEEVDSLDRVGMIYIAKPKESMIQNTDEYMKHYLNVKIEHCSDRRCTAALYLLATKCSSLLNRPAMVPC